MLIIEESRGDLSILIFAFIPLVWFIWSQGAKRCHDIGASGWMQLVPFYILWMIFQEGEPFKNNYGANPKHESLQAEVASTAIKTELPIIQKSVSTREEPVIENNSKGITKLEIQNVNYSSIQDLMRQLRTLEKVNQLSFECINTIANITINHKGTSQNLLEELYLIKPNIEVLGVTNGSITIKLK
jgi:hypothetical protein